LHFKNVKNILGEAIAASGDTNPNDDATGSIEIIVETHYTEIH